MDAERGLAELRDCYEDTFSLYEIEVICDYTKSMLDLTGYTSMRKDGQEIKRKQIFYKKDDIKRIGDIPLYNGWVYEIRKIYFKFPNMKKKLKWKLAHGA